MFEVKTIALFVITALAEIIGCYLPYLWLKEDKSILLLIPGALSLALFAWLLSLHPDAAGRVYAAYGGVYICVALLWLWVVDGVKLTMWDGIGGAVALLGMAIIMFAPKSV
ncbi:YnfA family protein [Pseudoalteromonas sp. SWN29]|uniref:YnfA family protein n=1 Tax=Pseudoalteromonas sp. SWN29 TaxID=2792064 RepID=UPI0018CFBB38|nr:YnfA family protein [Pseudoalteromonas sp. SWN29]MBH0028269.1 YnfA family protein [Pseudoalteromonas sp. SWN29]